MNYANVELRTTNLESKVLLLMKDIVLTWSSQSKMDIIFWFWRNLNNL